MLFVLTLLYLSHCSDYGTLARPITATLSSSLLASPLSPDGSIAIQRSIWDIIWSCLVTMTACSWVSSHPNIPDPADGSITVIVRRLKIMFWALIAPELIIMWAMRQFYGACRIRDTFREKDWTLTEGHFLQMGGFVYSSNGRHEVLSFVRFKDLVNSGQIQFPKVDRSQIEDKSKGDAFSKFVAIFQTSWFIVQCIARTAQHLPVTQLELATVALAAANALMYVFWWYKPQGVRCPIYIKATSPPSEDSPINGNTESPELRGRSTCRQQLPSGSDNAIGSSQVRPEALEGEGEGKTRSFYLLPRVSILRLMPDLVWRIDMGKTVTHVPMLYSIDPDGPDGENTRFYQIVVTGAAVGTIFGTIHCIAWNFEFPSRVENDLWRASSLVVTAIPVLLIITEVVYRGVFTSMAYGLLLKTGGSIYIVLSVMSVFLYITARIILLTEAVISLRRLPHSALDGVQWVLSIPHTG
ncbi:hypothetical protein BU17DRAFT_48575 [Hysterangium stoloniferum]|nr:hypothetical protein BU17DRAFT_48575 [Hysterangium stoloniferum]